MINRQGKLEAESARRELKRGSTARSKETNSDEENIDNKEKDSVVK